MEKDVEKYLVKKVESLGGMCIKNAYTYHVGFPDRTVLLPLGKIIFIELKDKDKNPTIAQQLCINKLRKLGFKAYVADCKEIIDKILDINYGTKTT